MLTRILRLLLSSMLGLGLTTALMWAASGGPRPARAIGPLYVALTGADTGNNCQNSASPCATIQRAVDVAEAGDEILVATGAYTGVTNRGGTDQHAYISQTVTIRGGYTATDWINSYPLTQPTTLDAQGAGRVIYYAGVPGALENLTVASGTTAVGNGGGIYASDALTLENVSLISSTANSNGGGAYVAGAAVVSGGLFQDNTSTNGAGGGLSARGTLMMTGTQFLSNTAQSGGGGANAFGAATLNGGVFQDNQCTSINCFGGGLYAGSTLALTDTQFLSNTSRIDGGGLYVVGTASLSGALFQGNHVTRSGGVGGGMAANDQLTLVDTQFLGNTAAFGGGGAYVNGAAALSSALFMSNTTSNTGGGLATSGSFEITDTQFISNSAAWGGGAFFSAGGVLSDSLFQGNVATSTRGGGLYTNSTLALRDTQFLSNTAVSDGGGAYVGGLATLNNVVFERNLCTGGTCRGGGLYAAITLTLTSTQFLTNAAVYLGGGAYANGTVTASGGLFAGNQCTDSSCYGGGLYAASTAALTGAQFLSNAATSVGGGLFANDMTLTNIQFYSNTAASFGGGAATFGTASLRGGIFANNRCTFPGCQGGGLYVSSGLIVTDTRFVSNAAFSGGAIYLFSNAAANNRVVNALFARNQAGGTGAGIYMSGYDPGSSLDILHTTIVSPTLGAGPAIYVFSGTVNITNTIVAAYATGIERIGGAVNEDYNLFFSVPITTTGGVASGGNSLVGDPVFINPSLDDYRLGAGSIAIDGGTDVGVTSDFESDARPLGGGFDIGYDEAFFRLYLPLIRR